MWIWDICFREGGDLGVFLNWFMQKISFMMNVNCLPVAKRYTVLCFIYKNMGRWPFYYPIEIKRLLLREEKHETSMLKSNQNKLIESSSLHNVLHIQERRRSINEALSLLYWNPNHYQSTNVIQKTQICVNKYE